MEKAKKKTATKKTATKKTTLKKVEVVPSGNNPRLQKIAEKLWKKDLLGTSQVLGCWLYLATPYRETKWGAHVSSVEVFYMFDGKFFMQYFSNYFEDGMEVGKEHNGHRLFNTFDDLEKALIRYFESMNR